MKEKAGILRGLISDFRGVPAFLLASRAFKCYPFCIIGREGKVLYEKIWGLRFQFACAGTGG